MTEVQNDAFISSSIRSVIQERLDRIVAENHVRILLAVESGSRAWGFPSPDSDYDVRFVYVRNRDEYLHLHAPRDVIETPLLDEIDLNGWDIRKALGLLLKSNAVIGEWMVSPIQYCTAHPVIERLNDLAGKVLNRHHLAWHYHSMGRKSAERWLKGDEPVPVKRYFYALRPALALRYLRLHPGKRLPMHVSALMEASELSRPLLEQINTLIVAKRLTNEQTNGARYPDLDALIRQELAILPESEQTRPPMLDRHRREADQLFLDLINAS
ncbi:nucleotidyltransferase domain-containing protein [Granulibacter bethesdensis]|uniref:nucleotidyltransferase domain-containing protein n=1 Tax=Granulibacter bethesdensis TaxID=364410 RepID=UPI0003F200AD|nr:nucleotidyltransferase domain-containing protein [Granulibacter bethesdensis]AHJ64684.1 putative cytosolic protein [Granulibacter bethesdensis CGDNIH4]